jgi:hypothetical protein
MQSNVSIKRKFRSCQKCGKQFERHRIFSGNWSNKKFCSFKCSKSTRGKRKDSYTTAELNFLHEVAENYSITYLYKKYKAEAKLQGWVIRNKHSIEAKLQKLGYSLKPSSNLLSISAVALMLDFKRSRVRHWTDEYGLEFVRQQQPLDSNNLMALATAAFVVIPAPINGASGNSTKSRSPISASSKNS